MTLLDALSTLPPDAELTLTVEQLREMLEGGGAQVEPEVIGTAEAAEFWPAYSQETWRRWAQDGEIGGAWKDTEAGPWRLPLASCRSLVDDRQRRAQTDGKRGPKGPRVA